MSINNQEFPGVARILWVMEQLRHPVSGCPWDKEQTFDSIVPFTIEEAYEVADAIAEGNMADIKDELGDLLFQVVFYAQLGQEQAAFNFDQIAEHVAEKLIRRHPHVFSDSQIKTEEELNANWEAIKQRERQEQGKVEDGSILANIPKGMVPMKRAIKLQKRCAKVGFDWHDKQQVADKIQEEIAEVIEACEQQDSEALSEEVGDLLFATLNLARHCNVDPEHALLKANRKFERRFRQVEELATAQQEQGLQAMSLQELELLWQQVKVTEKQDNP
ncbi:nucleoside triphosphate pyrophosphohydrolase [Planctobacterium marinum]|uniref:Nucleoside triphosphate pyrophosphohydrolase n=1 Tax=Planctobacterium marinum TaxID=1631968 RepID=A0AA48KRL0_9ALTE|nr:nucleoside triphosphate pyrophosphohydrolase [Planctobacterium marinum]